MSQQRHIGEKLEANNILMYAGEPYSFLIHVIQIDQTLFGAACVTGRQARQNQHGDDKRRQF